MQKTGLNFNHVYSLFLSEKTKKQFEKFIFLSAIVLYVLHFSLILLVNAGLLPASLVGGDGSGNILSAVYTPFSIILIYEIYLLIYYLPTSITSYLGHQYEVVTLIFIRKLFDDLSALVGYNENMLGYGELKTLSISFIGLLVLLLLIFLFYFINGKNRIRKENFECCSKEERVFVLSKKIISFTLILVFLYLFFHSMIDMIDIELSIYNIVECVKETNKVFFDKFFAILIISEVLLLIFTFNLSDRFSKIIRNSGFIISTFLLKLSFMTEGVYNIIIINIAVAFGVAVLAIHKLYTKKLQ